MVQNRFTDIDPQNRFEDVDPEINRFEDVDQAVAVADFSLEPTAFDTGIADPSGAPTIETPRQPQIGAAPERGFFDTGRAPLPPNASRLEKADRAFDVAIGTPLRVFLKFSKGKTLNFPDLMWAGLKKITPDDMWESDVKNMTLDQAMDWAAGNNPSGFEQVVGGLAEFGGRLATARQIGVATGIVGANLPKGITVIDKALEAAKVFGIGETFNQFQKLISQEVDPETDYKYEGALSVVADMGLGAGISLGSSLVSKSILTPIAKSPAGQAIIETYDKAMIEISKRFPVLADAIRKNPSKVAQEEAERQFKAKGIDTSKFSTEQRAVANHVTREMERRLVKASKNYKPATDIVKAKVRPKLLPGEVAKPTEAIIPKPGPTVPTLKAEKPPITAPALDIGAQIKSVKPEIERKPLSEQEVTTKKAQEASNALLLERRDIKAIPANKRLPQQIKRLDEIEEELAKPKLEKLKAEIVEPIEPLKIVSPEEAGPFKITFKGTRLVVDPKVRRSLQAAENKIATLKTKLKQAAADKKVALVNTVTSEIEKKQAQIDSLKEKHGVKISKIVEQGRIKIKSFQLADKLSSQNRVDALETVRQFVPKEKQSVFTKRILAAKTSKRVDRITEAVQLFIDRFEKRGAVNEFKGFLSKRIKNFAEVK